MRQTPGHLVAMLAALAILSGLFACAPAPRETEDDRVRALEAEVSALREEMRARDEALRDELALVRRGIDAVRETLGAAAALPESGKGPAARPEAATSGDQAREALDDELDVKARTFVKESLDRLLGITKKLLDRMDSELEKRDEPPAAGGATPQGQGDGT